MENFEKFVQWLKSSTSLKLLVIGFLMLLLLIPSGMIREIVKEREKSRDETIKEVSSKWGGSQIISGPLMCVPYYASETEEGMHTEIQHLCHILPEQCNISAEMIPEIRYRGIYKVISYKAKIRMTGNFNLDQDLFLSPENATMIWEKAFLTIGITDLKGIKQKIVFDWNGEIVENESGSLIKQIIPSGVTLRPIIKDDSTYQFSLDLKVNGSETLQFVPVGRETKAQISSSWDSPSFYGAYLPDDRNVNDNGFSAVWNVLQLNRDFPQQWINNSYSIIDEAFGVKLMVPVDTYQKSFRAVKYAILFILLTFLSIFLAENLIRRKIHPIQYLLIGAAIVVFYSLLLALAEHLRFVYAYALSSFAIIGLISGFTWSIFRNRKALIIITLELTALYAYLYIILQVSEYALLLGNLGLLIILGLTMFFSRKINWYGEDSIKKEG